MGDTGAFQRSYLDHPDVGTLAVAHVLPAFPEVVERPADQQLDVGSLDVLPAWLSELQDPAPYHQP